MISRLVTLKLEGTRMCILSQILRTFLHLNPAQNWFGGKQFSRIDVTNNIIHLSQRKDFSAKRGKVSEFSNRRGVSITRIWGKVMDGGEG